MMRSRVDQALLSAQGLKWLKAGVSPASLRRLGACVEQVRVLKRTKRLTPASVRWAARQGLDQGWWARFALTAPAWRAYQEAWAPAARVYEEARATAWRAYQEALAPAERAYEEARATSLIHLLWGAPGSP